MQYGTRSRTAEVAALQRALHLVLDDAPSIFRDEEVAALLSPPLRLLLRKSRKPDPSLRSLGRTITPEVTQLRGQIVVRSRYTEDKLQRRIDAGLKQYVVLSAGLDTFALRHTNEVSALQVFEVDQEDSQRWKRGLLQGREPNNVHFIPVDFEQQSIADALQRSTFNAGHPAFFSWLGTTYYLSRKAVFASLESILETAASGSEIVLDYWSEPADLSWRSNVLLSGVRFVVATQHEPMLSFFNPEELVRDVRALGFEVVENFTPDEARATWLAERSDQLDVPDFGYLLHLRVA